MRNIFHSPTVEAQYIFLQSRLFENHHSRLALGEVEPATTFYLIRVRLTLGGTQASLLADIEENFF